MCVDVCVCVWMCVSVCVTAGDSMLDELAHLEYETQVDLDHIEELLRTMDEAADCSKNDKVEQCRKTQCNK